MAKLEQPSVKQLNEALRIRKKIDAMQQETESLQGKLDRILGAAPTARKKAAKKTTKKRAKKKGTRRAKKSAKRVVRKKKTAKRGTVKKAPAPKLGDVITQILTQAKRPLNLDEIVAGIQKKGVTMRSKNPKHALGVKMYRDKKFKKARPGYFTVR